MNFPSYIIIRDNNAVVDLNNFLQVLGVAESEHHKWASYRIQELELVDGKDYIRYKNGTWKRYLVTLDVLKQMLRVGRGESLRQERANVKLLIDQITAAEVVIPENLIGFTFEMFIDLGGGDLTSDQLNKVPVLLIEGRAAVYGHELERRLGTSKPDRLTDWMSQRIRKHQLEEGKDYISFKGGCPGRPVRTMNYVISIEAAIEITEGEIKKKGLSVANYLKSIRQAVSKRNLPATIPLSDFVGLKPLDAESVDTLLAQPPVEEVIQPGPVQEAQPENCNPVTVDVVAPEPLTGEPAAAEDNELNAEPLGPDVEPQEHHTPTAEELGRDEQPKAEGVSLDGWESQQTSPLEDTKQVGPDVATEETPNVFDLIVAMAQNNLQQAQALAKLYRDLVMTQGTVSEMVLIEQAAARQKLGLYPGVATIPNVTLRDKINYAVNKRASATGEKQEDLFKAIYARLANDYGYSVLDFERKKGQSHLIVCEEKGLISIVWDIVNSRAFNQYTIKAAA